MFYSDMLVDEDLEDDHIQIEPIALNQSKLLDGGKGKISLTDIQKENLTKELKV